MPNNVSASFAEIWSREQQEVFYKRNVAMMVADTSFDNALRSGDTLNRPYRSDAVINVYSRGTDISETDLTDTNEQLVVDKQFANMFYVDDFDAIQSNYDIAANYGKDFGVALANQVDADVLYETINAANDLDAGDFGGTAGNGIAVTTSNVLELFSKSRKEIKKQNVEDTDLVAVISPEIEEIMINYGAARETVMGDQANLNGYFGRLYGYEIYTSNQLTASAQLAMATQPTAADTVTIQGVTFTFVASIGTTPGNVLLGADVDATRANLAALINAPATTTTTWVALSAANAAVFRAKFVAVNNNTADTLTVFRKGDGTITVSSALTAIGNVWTTARILQHNLFAVRGNPTLVMQRKPAVKVDDAEKRMGKYVKNAVLYGVRTFRDNSRRMVNVKVAASGF
jgi:hypothetical protein